MKRRALLKDALCLTGALGFQGLLPAWAQSGRANDGRGLSALEGSVFDLEVSEQVRGIAGRRARSILVNGRLPGPLLRWREGDDLTLRVHNGLGEDTSIHWHGILLPFLMDGVPGVSFPGIRPGETFTYRFPLRQAGTYWYHSHSGLQEQLGHYGPIVIEPREPDPAAFDREDVVLLSDWTFEDPHRVFARLKKMSDSYNFQQRTVGEFFRDVEAEGLDAALASRMMWGDMRMNPTDLSDVTGAAYTYLVNGHSPAENWTGLFRPGERVRLRFINASAMTLFNLRIPGLPMTVVQADGLDVEPVETDEFQIGVAETFDVIVRPQDRPYTVFCETNDRSGYARGTLAPREGMSAPVPGLRPRPLLTMKDMGMGGMEQGSMAMDDSAMDHSAMDHSAMDHSAMAQGDMGNAVTAHDHPQGPGVTNVARNPVNRLHERPLGLEDEPHRVLVYAELRSLASNPDARPPGREMELHLTGNMERYMWSFDGLKFSEVTGPLVFRRDERLRLTLVNDTMMPHPIHLHGMFFDVVTAEHGHKPRKHTIVVKPGEKLSLDVTADAPGDWAFHCHLLYHMHAGMMQVVSVVDGEAPENSHEHLHH